MKNDDDASLGTDASCGVDRGGSPKDRMAEDAISSTAAPAHPDFKFGANQVRDALLARLSELRASAPRLVATKQLQSSDARADQNRLELSGRSPLSQAFTDAEKALLRTSAGMSVGAFDRRGREYTMTCKLWKNDKHYRFTREGWKRFREAHHLTIDKEARLTRRVTVELWAFRSRALPPPAEEGRGGHPHPDGVLGLVMLLRDDGGGEREEAADEEVAAPVESYATGLLLLLAAIGLLTLRGMDTTKRKREDD